VAEGLAEDIQADLDARNWTMARTRLAELQKNRVALQRVLPAGEIGGYGVSLDALISQLGRQERPAALQSANRLSRAIVGFMAKYEVMLPAQVGYLDVAGRDVIYAAETGRWQDASAAAEELRTNYTGVGTHVAGKDSTLDRRVRQQLSQLDRRWRRRAPHASAPLPRRCSAMWISSSRHTDQSSDMTARRWPALAVMLCAVFLASVDFNIVTIAIPSIQRGWGRTSARSS